jgi:hypothetical protein
VFSLGEEIGADNGTGEVKENSTMAKSSKAKHFYVLLDSTPGSASPIYGTRG